jgi:hypothetical protein
MGARVLINETWYKSRGVRDEGGIRLGGCQPNRQQAKFRESTDRDPALAEVLTQILEALKEMEGRFEALEAGAME